MKIGPIEKDVSLPPWAKYPFAEMEVGDSFLIEFQEDDYLRVRRNVDGAIFQARRREKTQGRNFATRVVKQGTVKIGIRVWRTE